MKIPGSVRTLYAEQRPRYDRLKDQVDARLRSLAARRNWHYESRVKTELSMALKLESGRVPDPKQVEDFFACTLVVRNLSEISDAETQIRALFDLKERRPRSADWTHKCANAFPFDDLRLYVGWKDDQALPPSGLAGTRFEVQVKTFLQHAWGIATHDLIYKTDDVSWSRQRIAYQVKAMLEHAEVSIQEADRLAQTATLCKTQQDTQELAEIISVLKDNWDSDLLPPDLSRLADNTRTVMRLAKAKIADLRSVLDQERHRHRGGLPANISPYAIVVQAMAWHRAAAIQAGLQDGRDRILVTGEMELPDWLVPGKTRNVVFIKAI